MQMWSNKDSEVWCGCWCQISLSEYFIKLLIYWNFLTHPVIGFIKKMVQNQEVAVEQAKIPNNVSEVG